MRFQKAARYLLPLPFAIAIGTPAFAGEMRSSRAPAGGKVQLTTQTEQGSEADRMACTPDVFRLCGRYIPNVDGIVTCLEAQKPNLSPACRVVFDSPR